jgi:ketosteroid isomerase-like protein
MTMQTEDMKERFKEIVQWFEHLSPASLDSLAKVYAADAKFRDPFNDLTGRDRIRSVYQHMFETLNTPRFFVSNVVDNGLQAFVVWDFVFTVRGHNMHIHGCTQLVLDEAGLIMLHRDYWDAAEELYEKLPVMGGLLRWFKRRISIPH